MLYKIDHCYRTREWVCEKRSVNGLYFFLFKKRSSLPFFLEFFFAFLVPAMVLNALVKKTYFDNLNSGKQEAYIIYLIRTSCVFAKECSGPYPKTLIFFSLLRWSSILQSWIIKWSALLGCTKSGDFFNQSELFISA